MSIAEALRNLALFFSGQSAQSVAPVMDFEPVAPVGVSTKSPIQIGLERLAALRKNKEAVRQAEAEETVFLEDDFPPTRISLG